MKLRTTALKDPDPEKYKMPLLTKELLEDTLIYTLKRICIS